jgi:uncharacterized repeat protein (TIGR03847 family)
MDGGGPDYRPVRSITVDAVGAPGARTFYLQARLADGKLATILLEKTQALSLAEQAEQVASLLLDLPGDPGPAQTLPTLESTAEVMFRAGKLALQYDEALNLVGFEIRELRGIGQGEPACCACGRHPHRRSCWANTHATWRAAVCRLDRLHRLTVLPGLL